MKEVKTLLDDYKRRLRSLMTLRRTNKDDSEDKRLAAKEGCYRSFIAELERILLDNIVK